MRGAPLYLLPMQRTIVTSIPFLSEPSEDADPNDPADAATAADLVDTLKANRGRCVGMAANMIGERKRIIAFVDEDLDGLVTVMFNPVVTHADDPYETREGCLSLEGERPARRWEHIDVEYLTRRGRERRASFDGFTAQIIQHEIDHCGGVVI